MPSITQPKMGLLFYGLGASVALIFTALGISCLVINSTSNPVISCGKDGSPPLQKWVFGVGVGYTTFGAAFCLFFILMIILDNLWCAVNPFMVCTLFTTIGGFSFVLAWTIVGAVSLWGHGMDCYYTAQPVWIVSTATIIISIVEMVVFGILIVPTIATL